MHTNADKGHRCFPQMSTIKVGAGSVCGVEGYHDRFPLQVRHGWLALLRGFAHVDYLALEVIHGAPPASILTLGTCTD